MDKEFHYNITGIIAKRAGFNEEQAITIAHASQLVDDNDSLRIIHNANSDDKYEVYISQTMNILKPKRELMRIYPIFHFLPGDPMALSARRSDGKMHILTTTPGSERAYKIMKAAREDNQRYWLHRLGVAAHAFVDTWAHQNFVGWYDGINGEGINLLPNIGHADFIHHPDWVGHCWNDSRIIKDQVNNNHRFLDAAKYLFREFSLCITGTPNDALWPVLQKDLQDAMGPVFSGEKLQGMEARLEKYNKLFKLPDYDPHIWFNNAVETLINVIDDDSFMPAWTIFKDHYQWKSGWKNSDWYLFQEAVKAHQAFCMDELGLLFNEMNVKLGEH